MTWHSSIRLAVAVLFGKNMIGARGEATGEHEKCEFVYYGYDSRMKVLVALSNMAIGWDLPAGRLDPVLAAIGGRMRATTSRGKIWLTESSLASSES
mmetsp:Transcript_17919/g.51979  ORF Transcript_17919/g.51979 Transcript_17919/m.51979 type:complete len:97 (-) Transcript_17919:652-942(-)